MSEKKLLCLVLVVATLSLVANVLVLQAISVEPYPPVSGDTECAICEFTVAVVDQQLGPDRSEDEVARVVGESCNYIPSSIEAACDAIIETYGPEMIQLFMEGVDSDQVCPILHLCPR